MLVEQLIQTDYPVLQLTDKVSFAIQLMEDYETQNLPVVFKESYLGYIAKEDLLDVDDNITLNTLEDTFYTIAVRKEEFFLGALKLIVENNASLIPVISNSKEYLGVVTTGMLLEQLSIFVGTNEPGGVIILEIDRRNYSFGEISRLIETNDAYITQLNTYTESNTGLVIVTIKINKVEISDIIATFTRFEYTVRYHFGEELFTNELKDNYQHLMNYLNI